MQCTQLSTFNKTGAPYFLGINFIMWKWTSMIIAAHKDYGF